MPGLVVMELVSADAAGDRGGTGIGIEDPLYRRLLCVINARRMATTADWPGGAQTLALHPLQVPRKEVITWEAVRVLPCFAHSLCLLSGLSEHC